MIKLLIPILLLMNTASAWAAAGVTVWTMDDVQKVLPYDAAQSNSGLQMESPRLSYGSGQIIATCTGGGSCTNMDLTLPHLIHATVSYTIASTTNATPVAVTTTAAHGLSTGANVQITGTGIGALDNGVFDITVTSSTAFTLTGTTAPGSTASAGTVKPAIDKKHIVAYREDPLNVFYPSQYNTTIGEQPYYLVGGMVGAQKKDPYLGQTRVVFPVTINTYSPVYRKFTVVPTYGHMSNAHLPVNLFTNGTAFRNLTGWTLSATGTGTNPTWNSSAGVQFAAGASGTSKIEQCIRQWTGMNYLATFSNHGGTVNMQVGTASGLSDIVASTPFSTDGYVRWVGTTGTACIQYTATSGSPLMNEMTVTQQPIPWWFTKGTVTPIGAGWTDKSSVGVLSWSSGNGLSFANAGAAAEAQFVLQANTTYGIYTLGGTWNPSGVSQQGHGCNLDVKVGTTSGGADLLALTHNDGAVWYTFNSGANSGTGFLRLNNPSSGTTTCPTIYFTTGLSTGRTTLSGTYTSTGLKTYKTFISRSGSSASTPVGQFYWYDGTTWTGPVSMTGAAQTLNNGLSATFTGSFNYGEETVFYASDSRNQAVWLDVYADDVAVAGVYTGTAAVTTASPSTSTNVALQMTVLPLTVPANMNHWRTYYSLDELVLPSIHDINGETQVDLHKLWSTGCLRNHVTCGSGLHRYLVMNYTGTAITSKNYASANLLGKYFMDGLNTYGTLGWYAVPKNAAWSTLGLVRCPNQGGGTGTPTCDTGASYSGSNLTALVNGYNDASFGLTAKWLACTTVGCDASNLHNDWTNDDRLFMYGIDEPQVTTGAGSPSDVGNAIAGVRTMLNALSPALTNAMYGTTKEMLPATAGDGPNLRNSLDFWFAVEEQSSQNYNRGNVNFKVNGYGYAAQRDDYMEQGMRATRLGWYTACIAHGCAPSTTLGIDFVDVYGNPSPGMLDGTSKIGAADETLMNWRIITWLGWDWGRPQPGFSTTGVMDRELYYATNDASDCYAQGNYVGTCQTTLFDRVREEENIYMWITPGEGTFLVPARHTRADIGGSNDYVIETMTLKAIRQRIQDHYFLVTAYNNANDAGVGLNAIVKQAVISSVKYTKNEAQFRSMIRELHAMAVTKCYKATCAVSGNAGQPAIAGSAGRTARP